MLMLNYSHLNFKVEIPNKEDWKDIIQELVVFASDQVIPFELDSDWDFKTVADLVGKVYYDGVREDYYIEKKVTFNWNTYQARELIEPVYKTERKIKNELIEKSQFFKLFSLKIDSEYIDDNWHDASAYDDTVSDIRIIAKDVLLNLKEQEPLDVTVIENGIPQGIGRVGMLPEAQSVRNIAALVKEKFDLENVILYGEPEQKVRKIAICPGSGKSEIENAQKAGAELLITGDIGHHEGIDAVDCGLPILDATHYGLEHIFIAFMVDYLKQCQAEIGELEIIGMDTGSPITIL